MAWAKNSGVDALVAYTPTASRGTSTPSDTMRTATSQRLLPSENCEMRADAVGSSDRMTVASSPVMVCRSLAYARAVVWSVAMIMPPASGMLCRS